MGAWLIQPACVRCGALRAFLRNISPETRIDAEQIPELVASVCDECWEWIELERDERCCRTEDAFWEAACAAPPEEELGRLPRELEWSSRMQGYFDAWRATRPAGQTLRSWTGRTVTVRI